MDVRQEMGMTVHELSGPYELRPARRDGTGKDGGTLDRGLVARLPDGRRAVVGELWAMGPAEDGARVSYDVEAFAARVVRALRVLEELEDTNTFSADPSVGALVNHLLREEV